MVNTSMTHVFKHPKFYRIPRDKSDQAISLRTRDGECERAPDSGQTKKATSSKSQASSNKHKSQATSSKQQANEG